MDSPCVRTQISGQHESARCTGCQRCCVSSYGINKGDARSAHFGEQEQGACVAWLGGTFRLPPVVATQPRPGIHRSVHRSAFSPLCTEDIRGRRAVVPPRPAKPTRPSELAACLRSQGTLIIAGHHVIDPAPGSHWLRVASDCTAPRAPSRRKRPA